MKAPNGDRRRVALRLADHRELRECALLELADASGVELQRCGWPTARAGPWLPPVLCRTELLTEITRAGEQHRAAGRPLGMRRVLL